MKVAYKMVLAGLVLLFTNGQKLAAQYSVSKYELGVNLGTLVYQGDLSEKRIGYTRGLKPSLGLNVTRHFDSYFALRGGLTLGQIHADESTQSDPEYRQHRNFRFRAPVAELSAMLVWSPAGNNSNRRLNYYFMGGIGLSYINPTRYFGGLDTAYFDNKSAAVIGLASDILHPISKLLPVIPVGMGLRYQLSPAWSLNTEFLYRFTPTDYLDGFSRSVNPKVKDRYYGLSIGVSYRFGSDKYRCPRVN